MDKFILAVDSQRIGALDCLWKYNLRFNLNLEKDGNNEGIEKGTLFHELLKHYYLAKGGLIEKNREEVIEGEPEQGIVIEYQDPLSPFAARDYAIAPARRKIPELNLSEDAVTDCISTFHEYVEKYSGENWNIKGVEQPFSVILYEDDVPRVVQGTEYSGLIILYEGIIDLEVETGEEFAVDHKTSSRKNYYDELNNQFMGYAFVKRSKLVIINEIIFKKDPDKFHRSILTYQNHLIDTFVESVIFNIQDRLIPAIDKDRWTHNFHACNQKFGCSFADLCKADPQTKKWVIETKYRITKPWDPLSRDE